MFGITNNPKEYEKAFYCPQGREIGKLISVEYVTEREKRYSNLLQTLTTAEGSTVVKTSYAYPYAIGQEILYRGEVWIIRNIREISDEINAVSLRISTIPQGKRWAMELVNITTAPTATLEYNPNGATSGTTPISVTASRGCKLVLSSGVGLNNGSDIVRWNTKADGTGTNYALGGDFVLIADTILFAKWN